MLSKKQTEQVKAQLLSQLENSEVQNKEQIKESIKAMDSEQLEIFLKQNKLVKESENQCIFCSIVEGSTSSYKIDEIPDAIAVLEINPVSKAHCLAIPKTHSEETPKQVFDLAEKVAKKISQVFNPKKIDLIPSTLFGHEIINILPVYTNEDIHSPKTQASSKELQKIQQELKKTKEKPKVQKEEEEIISDKNTWLPRRIP